MSDSASSRPRKKNECNSPQHSLLLFISTHLKQKAFRNMFLRRLPNCDGLLFVTTCWIIDILFAFLLKHIIMASFSKFYYNTKICIYCATFVGGTFVVVGAFFSWSNIDRDNKSAKSSLPDSCFVVEELESEKRNAAMFSNGPNPSTYRHCADELALTAETSTFIACEPHRMIIEHWQTVLQKHFNCSSASVVSCSKNIWFRFLSLYLSPAVL